MPRWHAWHTSDGKGDTANMVEDCSADSKIEFLHGDLDIEDGVDENVNDTDSIAFRRRQKRLRPRQLSAREKLYNNLTIVAAVCAGVTVAIVKFAAAVFTGSSAMFSEGVHSLVDAANDSLLLVGTKASKRKPTLKHPFGYGKLLYFYTFVVSLIIFLFGGGFVIMQGVQTFMAGGAPIESPIVNYVVLAVGCVFEGVSLRIALADVNKARGEMSIAQYIHDSKSPTNFTVLLEDSAAVLGMLIAFLGILISDLTGIHQVDSLASILIGCVMAAVALVLLTETRSLLVGEGLEPDEVKDIEFIVEDDPVVIKCGRILSMYQSPDDMVLALDVTFDDELDEGDVLKAIDRIEAAIVNEYPQCSSIFIEAESLNQVYRQRYDRRQELKRIEEEEED